MLRLVQEKATLRYDLCQKIRDRRFNHGGMKLNKTKIVFSKSERNDGIPESFGLEDHSASHWMIEELMLLSNQATRLLRSSSRCDFLCAGHAWFTLHNKHRPGVTRCPSSPHLLHS